MYNRIKIKLSLLIIIILSLGFGGCSHYTGPSDAEVKKIIEESIIANQSRLTASIEILDKGKRQQKDSWYFIARTSYKHYLYGNTTRESMYFFVKEKDRKTGKNIWKITDARDLKVVNKSK
jgi:hypothetical protein